MKKKSFCLMRLYKEVYKFFIVCVKKKKKKEIDNLRIFRFCLYIIYYSNVFVEFVIKFKCEEYF